MKYIIILSSVLILSGCGSVLKSYGDYVDRSDPCLKIGKPDNYKYPNFCGSTAKSFGVMKLGNNRYMITK